MAGTGEWKHTKLGFSWSCSLIRAASSNFKAKMVSSENRRSSVCEVLRPSGSLSELVLQAFEEEFPDHMCSHKEQGSEMLLCQTVDIAIYCVAMSLLGTEGIWTSGPGKSSIHSHPRAVQHVTCFRYSKEIYSVSKCLLQDRTNSV